MRFFVDVLTGVPSIMFGLFIYIALIVGTGSSYAAYKGAFALALLMLPVVTRSAEVVLLLVPGSLRESALALGAPRWKVIFRIVLPTALPGLLTGVLLAVARAAGETAPLLFTAGATMKTSFNLSGFMNSLPIQIYTDVTSPTTAVVNRAWGAALTLVVMILLLNLVRAPARAQEQPGMSAEEPTTSTSEPSDELEEDLERQRRARRARMSAEETTRRCSTPAEAKLPRPPRRPAAAAPMRARTCATGLAVKLEKLRAFYGDVEQVKGIDLDFHANEVTAIIGPSGCGKSTMVRCINRMHEEVPGARAEGKVLLDDFDIYDPSVDVVAVRRAIGMVFQKPNPFPTMSVFDNVAAGLRLASRRTRRSARTRWRRRCAAPDCGRRSRTASPSRARASPAASSSACASRARWRWSPR